MNGTGVACKTMTSDYLSVREWVFVCVTALLTMYLIIQKVNDFFTCCEELEEEVIGGDTPDMLDLFRPSTDDVDNINMHDHPDYEKGVDI